VVVPVIWHSFDHQANRIARLNQRHAGCPAAGNARIQHRLGFRVEENVHRAGIQVVRCGRRHAIWLHNARQKVDHQRQDQRQVDLTGQT